MAGKAFEEILKKVNGFQEVSVGSFAGFEITASYSAFYQKHTITIKGHGKMSFTGFKSGLRNLEEIREKLISLPMELRSTKERLKRTETDLEKAMVELEKEFAYADELKEKNHRLTELNILLNVEGGAGKEELLKSAKDVQTSAEMLSKLRENDSVEVREAVAGNLSTSVDDLLMLKDDPEQCVQLAAYSNVNMPEKEVWKFCKQADDELLSKVLDGPNVTDKILSVIVERVDEHSNLSYKVAKNKKMTPKLLEQLARKSSKYIYRDILERKDLLPETFEFIADAVKDDWFESQNVAKHPMCSEERMLSFVGKSMVEDRLLHNPNITIKVLEKLVKEGGFFVKERAKEMLEKRKEQSGIEKENCSGVSLDEKMILAGKRVDSTMKVHGLLHENKDL